MERCERYLEQISCYVDGELGTEEQAELLRHLEACPACMGALVAYQTMSAGIQDAEVEPPAHLVEDVMARIAATQLVRARPKRPYLRRFVAAAAVFAVVGVIGFYSIWGGPGYSGIPDADWIAAPAPAAGVGYSPIAELAGEVDMGSRMAPAENAAVPPAPPPYDAATCPGAEDEIVLFTEGPVFLDAINTTLLDRFVLGMASMGEPWRWTYFTDLLWDAGYVYTVSEDVFSVRDPYNPDSLLYGLVEGRSGFAESVVTVIGYRFYPEDGRYRWVEVRLDEGGVLLYYYAVPSFGAGGVRTAELEHLRNFILMEQR